MDNLKPIYQMEEAETPIQQATLNCVDSWNVDLAKKSIDKMYRVDAKVYKKDKLIVIGTNPSYDKILFFRYILVHLLKDKKGKPIPKETVLFSTEIKIDEDKETGQIKESDIKKALDKGFLTFQKECIGLFSLVAEQKISNESGTSKKG